MPLSPGDGHLYSCLQSKLEATQGSVSEKENRWGGEKSTKRGVKGKKKEKERERKGKEDRQDSGL